MGHQRAGTLENAAAQRGNSLERCTALHSDCGSICVLENCCQFSFPFLQPLLQLLDLWLARLPAWLFCLAVLPGCSACLPVCLPVCLHVCLPVCLSSCLSSCQSSCLPGCSAWLS